MLNRIQNWGDVIGGVVLAAIGAVFILAGRDYTLGTPFRMGPGALPLVLSLIVIALGAVIALNGLRKKAADDMELVNLRPLLFVSLSILVFALSYPLFGFLPAIVVTTVVCALADHHFNLRVALITAVVLAALCWLLFPVALGLPVRLIGVPF